MRIFIKLLLVITLFFVLSCKLNTIKDEDHVKLNINELPGKYMVNYQVYAAFIYNVLPNSSKNFSDTFELKFNNNKTKLVWQSLSTNKVFQFEADVKSIPIESSGYKIAKIQFFGDHVKYTGTFDTITVGKNWKLYNINDRDEYAYFVKQLTQISLAGTDVSAESTKCNLKASPQADLKNEWILKFRINNCNKLN